MKASLLRDLERLKHTMDYFRVCGRFDIVEELRKTILRAHAAMRMVDNQRERFGVAKEDRPRAPHTMSGPYSITQECL